MRFHSIMYFFKILLLIIIYYNCVLRNTGKNKETYTHTHKIMSRCFLLFKYILKHQVKFLLNLSTHSIIKCLSEIVVKSSLKYIDFQISFI